MRKRGNEDEGSREEERPKSRARDAGAETVTSTTIAGGMTGDVAWNIMIDLI
jgi:hypothetical protein